MALGGLIGAGVGAIGPQLFFAGRKQRQLLKKDVEALERGKLGKTEAEKRQAVGAALQQARAGTREAEAEMRRDVGATGGFGRSGAQAQRMIGAQQAEQATGAQAMAAQDIASQQQVSAKEQAIRSALERQLGRAREDWQRVGTAAGEAIDDLAIRYAAVGAPTGWATGGE